MAAKPFAQLRPMLLSIVVGILSLFGIVQIVLMIFLGYTWYKNPIMVTQNHLDAGIIVLSLLMILTYFMKYKFQRLMAKKDE